MIEPNSNNPQDDIFEKFKQSTSSAFSAFKLFKNSSVEENSDSSHFESEDGWIEGRKKRGCYRKYTVEEKEEAVKKVKL